MASTKLCRAPTSRWMKLQVWPSVHEQKDIPQFYRSGTCSWPYGRQYSYSSNNWYEGRARNEFQDRQGAHPDTNVPRKTRLLLSSGVWRHTWFPLRNVLGITSKQANFLSNGTPGIKMFQKVSFCGMAHSKMTTLLIFCDTSGSSQTKRFKLAFLS